MENPKIKTNAYYRKYTKDQLIKYLIENQDSQDPQKAQMNKQILK